MKTKIKNSAIGVLAATLVAPLVFSSTTLAWGPERPEYTNEKPANHAVFNSITNNALVGNEFDFVRIMEKNTNTPYVSNLTIEPGKRYEVYIYYHNNASATYNDKAHNYVGVANGVRLISDFPKELAKGETGRVLGKITSTNTDPEAVWDEAFITASEAMTLHYIEGSAKIFNKWNKNGTLLSTRLFSPEGTLLGLAELNGIILGCDEYSGSITYTIETEAVDAPEPDPEPVDPCEVDPEGCVDPPVPCAFPEDCPTPSPEPDPDPDPEPPAECETPDECPVTPDPFPDPDPDPEPPVEPVVPSELPETGPVEIILAVVVVGLITAGVIYWSKTHKAVKRTTKKAKGRK